MSIPKAGQIDVPDAPDIHYSELIQQILANVSNQIEILDNELAAASASDKIDERTKELYGHIHEIKLKTGLARESVIAISTNADTKKLDLTNKILNKSDTLKRIKKLTKLVADLENELKLAEYDYYRIVAEYLIEVKENLVYFDSFIAIPHIILIKNKVTAIEFEIGRQVQWSFREIGSIVNSDPAADPDAPAPETSINLESLNQIYLVVDALGVGFRKDLLERFAQLQLIPYEKLFKSGMEYSGIEYINRRFTWFEKLLKAAEARLSEVIPSNWHLPYFLFMEFTRRTKNHVIDVLSSREKENPDLNTHVQTILKSLKMIISFENKMRASLSIPLTRAVVSDEDGDVNTDSVKSNNEVNTMTFSDSIADAYDNYLGPYVQLERENLEKMMQSIVKEEESTAESASTGEPEFPSSKRMFAYIKESLKRCTEFSVGITYLSLSKEFRICLQHYSESLKFRCPTPVSFKDVKNSTTGVVSKVPVYELTSSKEDFICRIVNTAIYCMDTVPPLESMMKRHIHPSYENQIDFGGQMDAFIDLINYSFNIIVMSTKEKLDEPLKEMRKTNWQNIDSVGDSSPYVKSLLTKVGSSIPRMRTKIHVIYFQKFVNDLASMVLDAFLETIWRLKRVSKTGGAQLLMDLNGIDEYLMKLPNARLPKDSEPLVVSKAYKSFVTARTGRIENILKLVCTEDEQLNEMFKLLWVDGTQADLDRIIELKKGSFLPIPGAVGAVVDKVGDHIKEKLNENMVGRGMVSAAGELKDAAKSVGGGIGKVMGDITGGMASVFSGTAGLFSGESDGSSSKPTTSTTAKTTSKSGSNTTAKSGTTPAKKPTTTTGKDGKPAATKKPASSSSSSGGGGLFSF